MKKTELINAIAERTGATKKDTGAILEALGEVILETLKNDVDEKITIAPLGSFKTKNVPERTGKVMMGASKGETWVKPAHTEIVFKVSKTVKTL